MPLNNLSDLFLHELKDVYHAEKQITKALPKMAKAASSPKLRKAFEKHLQVTQEQVARLEQIFENLGKAARGTPCDGMKGLLEEGSKMMEEEAAEAVMDAALISAAQRVEHYEIAAYGCLVTYAKELGDDASAELLAQTLGEEEETDEELSALAEEINRAAMEVGAE